MNNIPVIVGTKDEFLSAQKKHKEAESERAKARKLCLHESIGRLFGFLPALNQIIIKGYTPSFNDGDPCTHSQMDPYINGTDEYGDRDDDDSDGDEEESDKEEDSDGEADNDEAAPEPLELTNEDRELVSSEMNTLADMFESVLGTNWKLTIERQKDGTISWEQEDYDCGN